MKDIKIEDLLGREPVKYSLGLWQNQCEKTVLVTGAGGLLIVS